MIDDYHFGSITINGDTYNRDVIIHGDEILNPEWWRKEGHSIAIEDLGDFPGSFEVLVIGNGASGVCDVPQETLEYLKKRGEVFVSMTKEATEKYNQFLDEGKDVVGAFHLTC